MVFCSNCGTENIDGAVFCAKCGNELLQHEIKVKKDLKTEIIDPPEPKISTSTAIWLILALIFIFPIGVIGLILVYWNLQKKKELWQQERIINRLDRRDL